MRTTHPDDHRIRDRHLSVHLLAALIAISAALATSAQPVSAQAWIAPQVAWGDDLDLALGARFGISMNRLVSADPNASSFAGVDAIVSFEWFFDCSGCSYFEITPGLRVPVELDDRWAPYIGGGLNIARFAVDTGFLGQSPIDNSDVEIGLALFGGLEFPIRSLNAFSELRVTLGGAGQAVLSFGLKLGGD